MRHPSRLLFPVLMACILSTATLRAQTASTDSTLFALLNLDYPGLEQVKAACARHDYGQALAHLLHYYRHRQNVRQPEVDLTDIHLSPTERQWADEALQHTFFAHAGYQPSFNYGEDINWRYWPVRDNELRWQLHRHKWFVPMGKAYRLTHDERYASEWVHQFADWIKKNPLVAIDKEAYELTGDEPEGEAENVRFAWRPLETAHRMEDQTRQFPLFIDSPAFTPEFLALFLANYHTHALHVLANYSAEGNHLLFEAQRMVYAGVYFPEFKEAPAWRKSGIDILNREIAKQVYNDGGQYELDLHYHAAAINIFRKALEMATANGLRSEFPPQYVATMERMVNFYVNLLFPDYSIPCFSDSKRASRRDELQNLNAWLRLFPHNELLRWAATEGREGRAPAHRSTGFTTSGFFALRNGWGEDATVMVLKAGPKGEWHCQPDNGTFELWHNGRNLFPDSGFYIYAGEGEVMEQRNWFRQTRVHNTLTLDNRNLETTQSVTRLMAKDMAHSPLMPRSIYAGYSIPFLEEQLEVDSAHFNVAPSPLYPDSVGKRYSSNIYDWTSGFFPGCLWYAYELTGDDSLRLAAIDYTNRLNPLRRYRDNHDIGFMVYCSYGNALRLAPSDTLQAVLVESADNLLSRFDPRIGCIRSWDFGEWNYPVIIDNMMNLELLFAASRLTGRSISTLPNAN